MSVVTSKDSRALPTGLPETAPISLASEYSTANLALVLGVCALAPYANTLLNGFVYDDNTQVMNNPYIQNFHHLKEIFTTTVWSYVGTQGVTNYYRPAMTLGYLVCYHLFGPLAYGFHLANIVFNVAAACALFFVTWSLLQDRGAAFASAAVFALHPIHSESVAWIAAVTDLELTFFCLLAFHFFLALSGSMRVTNRTPSPGSTGAAASPPSPPMPRKGAKGLSETARDRTLARLGLVGSFTFALLSKEQALTLPALATIYEHCYRDDRAATSLQQKVSRYGVLWLLAVAYVLLRVHLLGSFAPVTQMRSLGWYQAALSAASLTGQYLWKMVWPVRLCAFYVFIKSTSLLDARVIAGLAASALMLALFVALWRRERVVSFGVLWFFVTLAPVVNVRWMAANVFTERYLYLPSVGLCWIAGWGWSRLWTLASGRGPLAHRALLATSVLLAVLCGIRVVTRNRDWRNDIQLYTVTLAASPDAYPIRNNLGAVYWRQGDVRAAEREWTAALRLNPQNAIVLNNLGLLCSKEKRYEEAIRYLRRAMRLKPNYTDPHLNLGTVYLEALGWPNSPAKREPDPSAARPYQGVGAETDLLKAAELQLRAAVALSPLNIQARNALGKLYLDQGRLAESEEQFRHSVESEPNLVAYDSLGDLYTRQGEHDKAMEAFRRAVSLESSDSHGHFGLATLYAALGRNSSAVREYKEGLKTDPANQEALAALRELTTAVRDGKN